MVLIALLLALMVLSAVEVYSETSKSGKKSNSVSDSEVGMFVPTNEWQVLRDGQVVPAGLHYRINLQTGLKEAKLLDENDKESDPRSAITLVSPKTTFDYNGPEEKIKHSNSFKSVEPIDQHSSFKSHESFKKEFQELNLQIKSDLELLADLLARFALKDIDQHTDEEEIKIILTHLEYLVHQRHNAQEFAHVGGITDVIYPCLNASSVAIRSEAILLLGSAIQNNPKLQIMALESGSITYLLRLLMFDDFPVIRARTVYALSCLIRRFPVAQLKMINGGGLTVLGQLFQNEGQNDLKLQIKIITLFYDLIMEYKEANDDLNVPDASVNLEELVEKQRQYKTINLPQHLVEGGWCKKLLRLLRVPTSSRGQMESSMVAKKHSNGLEHDMVEKIIQAMLALFGYCTSDFRVEPNLQENMANLQKWYDDLSMKEQLGNSREDSDYCLYYTNLAQQLQELLEKLKLTKNE